MHIGRADQLPPPPREVAAQQAQHAHAAAEASRGDPSHIARTSVPTGEKPSQPASYNPVIDLITRVHTKIELPPPPPESAQTAAAYRGTPPAPSVVDLQA